MLRNLDWLLDAGPASRLRVADELLAARTPLRGTVTARLGFELHGVRFEAWTVVAWTGKKAAACLFQVQPC